MFSQENFLPNLLFIMAAMLLVVAGSLIVARHRALKAKAEYTLARKQIDQKLGQ